jgi:hypothetical protein
MASARRGLRPAALWSALAEHLALDLRSVALFRIALGLVLVADILVRLRDFSWHYGEHGVLPQAVFLAELPWSWSLHAAFASEAWVLTLMLVQLLLGLALASGVFTRTSALLAFVLFTSLDNRNPFVLSSGDTLLRLMLLFGSFLPLGARASVDRRRLASGGRDSSSGGATLVGSAAAVAITIQAVVVYSASGIHKLLDPEWLRLDGSLRSFDAVQFSTSVGAWLTAYPGVCMVLSLATLVLEVLGPVGLVLLPGRWRMWLCFAFIGFHLGSAVTLRLGIFPYAGVVLWTVFLPAYGWDQWLPRRLRRPRRDATPIVHLQRSPRVSWIPLSIAALVVVWSTKSVHTGPFNSFMRTAGLAQSWRLFTPPARVSGWIVAPARHSDGSEVDALGGDAFDRRSIAPRGPYDSDRERKLRTGVLGADARRTVRLLAAGVCRRWGPTLGEFRIVMLQRWNSDPPDAPLQEQVIHSGRCSPP